MPVDGARLAGAAGAGDSLALDRDDTWRDVPRPVVSFVSWSFVSGRSSEIAEALGGESHAIYSHRLTGKRLAPVRYLLSSVETVAYLLRRRPRSVIATLPPVFPGLIAWAYSRVARVPLVLDSHPSGFGMKGDTLSRRLLPVHRWLARRASATMVTTEDWTEVVDGWGGSGLVVHEAPSMHGVRPAGQRRTPLQALFVGVFSADEPVDAVVEAARGLEDVHVSVTGDLRKARPGLVTSAPDNVTFLGYLDAAAYRQAVEQADVILALTTEPTSVMRAAYEAVYAGRPLIASDQEAIRALFDHAVLVSNDAAGIRAGILEAADAHAHLVEAASTALVRQRARWDDQLAGLRQALRLTDEDAA